MKDNPIRRALLDRRQTDDDKPDANPFDTSPKTEAEAIMADEVQRQCMEFQAKLQISRGSITLQELVDAKWARVHLEGELPPVQGVNHGLYFYSIDGQRGGINGEKFNQCLLGGDAILVSAENRIAAGKIAQEGLLYSIEQANHYAFAQEMGVDPTGVPVFTQQNPGIAIDTEVRKKK